MNELDLLSRPEKMKLLHAINSALNITSEPLTFRDRCLEASAYAYVFLPREAYAKALINVNWLCNVIVGAGGRIDSFCVHIDDVMEVLGCTESEAEEVLALAAAKPMQEPGQWQGGANTRLLTLTKA